MSKYHPSMKVTETPDSLTFFDDQYRTFQARRGHPNFDKIVEALVDGDIDEAKALLQPITVVAEPLMQAASDIASNSRVKVGEITINDWGVTIDGEHVGGYVIDQLLRFRREGLDYEPLLNFVRNLFANPSMTARNEAYQWLEAANMPITPDGHFIAYKRVRNDYKDAYSGRYDNSVGKVVEMPRHLVDDNRRNECSAGLHFCSQGYLHAYAHAPRIMIVKINPADIVAVPEDYGRAKGRTWRYEVVGEIDENEVQSFVGRAVWGDYVPSDDEDADEYYDDDADDDDDLDGHDDDYYMSRDALNDAYYDVYGVSADSDEPLFYKRVNNVLRLLGEIASTVTLGEFSKDQMDIVSEFWEDEIN